MENGACAAAFVSLYFALACLVNVRSRPVRLYAPTSPGEIDVANRPSDPPTKALYKFYSKKLEANPNVLL